jgi:hypothetical protein
LTAEGPTREEALRLLRQAWQHRLQAVAEIAPLDLSAAEYPLAPFGGTFKDNPLFDSWQEAIADFRRQAEEEGEKS